MQENHRKLLTYAYNIVGSYEDAKDLVQDVMEKYITLDKSNIRDEKKFLIKSTINHAINFKNRQKRKEVFGEWLPEPISFDNTDTKLIKEQTAGYTMLVLLENLNPKERAIFILKEGFAYSHAEIAALLDISQDNSRQLLSRAIRSLKSVSYLPDNLHSSIQADILEKYQTALSKGNIRDLEDLLVSDVKLKVDGGTKVQIVKGTEMGKINTAALLTYVQQQFLYNSTFSFHQFNHQPAICFWKNEKLHNCHILSLNHKGQIENIYSIVDPTKLKKLLQLSRF